MVELTPDNILDYLCDRGWVRGPEARASPLGGGVSNVVFRVQTPERTFVVKQSRTRLRTRDLWLSDVDRIYREQEVMEALYPRLPENVPEVLFSDRENHVFAMSHAVRGSRVWKEALLTGQVDPDVAERAGSILGIIHEWSATDPRRFQPFSDHTVFVQLRVDPFYRRVQERRPEVAAEVQRVMAPLLTVKEALCHGDYSPKNMLIAGPCFMLVDYETAHLGDPTMDLGFFLSHLLLKSLRRCEERRHYFHLTSVFWSAYSGKVRFRPIEELQARAIGHLAVCLLARIDGTSPVDYLHEEPRREAARRLGRRLLVQRPERWHEVLALCEEEWSRGDLV